MSVLVTLEHSILTVTLNRPARLNALVDPDSFHDLSDAWAMAADPEVRAVVVTGAGRGFCAGVDLKSERAPERGPMGGLRHSFNPHVLALAALAKPVIAAVNGPAAGAGLALACAADIRIASTAAIFVPSFITVGVVPDSGATYFVPRILGHARATEWLLGGESLNAQRALQWGLVSEVVSPEALHANCLARARHLAALPPTAVGLTKALLIRSATSSLADQLEAETVAQDQAVHAPERLAARADMVARLEKKERARA